MPPTSNASVAIDLGTSAITTVVGERDDLGQLHILGVGRAPSSGIEAGQISHVSRAADSIRASLDQAEASSGRQILSVGIALSGAHLQSMNNRGAVALPSIGEPIRDADLVRAIDSGRAVTINHVASLVHAIPRYYVVDADRRSFDPRGQHGQRLDVSMHLVTASQSAIQNAAHCVQNAGVDVELIAAKPVVAAERAVRSDEKEFGALVVGLDSGTTTLTAFEDGAISHTSALPIGTSHIARDLSVGLHCANDEALSVMRSHGWAIPQLVPNDTAQIQLRGFSADGGMHHADPSLVAEIINARASETISMIANRIAEFRLQHSVAGGIILIGSGATLQGIDLLFSKALESPARIGEPGDLYGLADKLRHPNALGAVGMLDWMLDSGDAISAGQSNSLGRQAESGGSLLDSLYSGLSGFVRAFSPNSNPSS
ncbi:MAG: cell division protein FtsA [Chloroflexi bacterium]|nr:cell division protein FtsA [Chloroflexota bacterium]MCY3697433.1 cell division protein FtsA [Chloroflexota bacterium]MXX81160.1 cell division protein FtsA [Chloroflexota bacterium]MYF22075.1 cell division protein FtsA [Chloroflexota bacterium]